MARYIPVAGDVWFVHPKNGRSFTLDELYDLVGEPIEIIPAPYGRSLVLNENGKLEDLPYNRRATFLMQGIIQPTDYIVGAALLCDPGEVE